MSFSALLLKILGSHITKALVLAGLEQVAKRSDNTVDDEVVKIVKAGLENREHPIEQAAAIGRVQR